MENNNKANYLPDFNAQETIGNVSNTINDTVSNTYNSVKDSVKDSVSDFSSTNYIDAGKDFLESNSLIAKFAFLLLVVIVFIFLFNLGIWLIAYIMQNNRNPLLINGMINGNQYRKITQDPKSHDSIAIFRSNNRSTGIEFSWSVWLNIIDPGKTGFYSHIFNMGNGDYDNAGIATVNNGPGLYLTNNANFGTLHIVMDTIQNINKSDYQSLDVEHIPLNKWFHVVLRLENNILDVYINGVITSRMNLDNVPRLNYNDIFVCNNGGFNGSLSNLQYHDYALNVFEINKIVSSGPNTNAAGSNTKSLSQYSYLSGSWYNSKLNNL